MTMTKSMKDRTGSGDRDLGTHLPEWSGVVRHAVDGEDRYLIWSGHSDRPASCGRALPDFLRDLEDLSADLPDWTRKVRGAIEDGGVMGVSDVAPGNRAGRGGTELTVDQLVEIYFARRVSRDEPEGDGDREEDELPVGRSHSFYRTFYPGPCCFMPTLSAYLPLAALHFASLDVLRHLSEAWPCWIGEHDIGPDLGDPAVPQYLRWFDVRTRHLGMACPVCFVSNEQRLPGDIDGNWRPSALEDPFFASADYDAFVSFHLVHAECVRRLVAATPQVRGWGASSSVARVCPRGFLAGDHLRSGALFRNFVPSLLLDLPFPQSIVPIHRTS